MLLHQIFLNRTSRKFFVVMENKAHYDLTKYHILSTDDTNKFIPPTRQYQGECKLIGAPTTTTYQRQLKAFTEKLEAKCNDLWRNICHSRGFNKEVERYFCSYNTQLPTMYILLKTHKFQSDDINSEDEINKRCKVRPIVSCCGSPCEKLAWLCTYILSPILEHIPKNIFEHLERLKLIPQNKLHTMKFCSADISALYTNLSIEGCIDDTIQMASEFIDSLDLLGLKLVDVHKMLELVLGSSFFTFDNKLYQQLIGLFMGCKPSPICAVVRVYTFERRSIYITSSITFPLHMDDISMTLLRLLVVRKRPDVCLMQFQCRIQMPD